MSSQYQTISSGKQYQMMLDLLEYSPRSHTNTWVRGKWDINGVRSDHMSKTIGGVLIEI